MGWIFGRSPRKGKRRRSSQMPATTRKRPLTKAQRWARDERREQAWMKRTKHPAYRSPQFRKFWPNL